MTEQHKEAFKRWHWKRHGVGTGPSENMPSDMAGRWETWQAALSRAEGKAQPVAVDLERYDAGILGSNGGGHVGWWHDYIRAVLEDAHDFYLQQVDGLAHPAPQVAVPEGWKLVPVEETPDMRGAGVLHSGMDHEDASEIWARMIAAAPTHKQEE